MTTAIISDIHAEIGALEAVLEDIRAFQIKDIICLGDLVGYGQNPAEVVDRAMEWRVTLRGNHDEAARDRLFGFNPVARAAVEWTHNQLKPRMFASAKERARWRFFCDLPDIHEEHGLVFVHASPRDRTMEYVLPSHCEDGRESLRDIFARFETSCFAGHTHLPGVITDDFRFIHPHECGSEFQLEPNRKFFVNVGSVGAPPQDDRRPCYVILEGKRVRWRRADYEVPPWKWPTQENK